MAENSFTPFGAFDLNKMMGDFSKMMGDVKLPGVNMESLLAMQRKNFEALAEANKVAVEGMQNVARRQAEILAQAMAEGAGAAQQVAGVTNPQELGAKQAELIRQSLEKAMANLRELSELVQKSNSDAFGVLSQRVNQNIEELKTLTTQK